MAVHGCHLAGGTVPGRLRSLRVRLRTPVRASLLSTGAGGPEPGQSRRHNRRPRLRLLPHRQRLRRLPRVRDTRAGHYLESRMSEDLSQAAARVVRESTAKYETPLPADVEAAW